MPVRVQLSRRKGWRMPENTVKVDRSTRWGNPYNWKDLPRYDKDAEDFEEDRRSDATLRFYATSAFEAAVKHNIGRPKSYPTNEDIIAALRGKNLACWCPEGNHCHADVLLAVANAPDTAPCGGCGETDSNKRCIGCMHDFAHPSSQESGGM